MGHGPYFIKSEKKEKRKEKKEKRKEKKEKELGEPEKRDVKKSPRRGEKRGECDWTCGDIRKSREH